MRSVCTQLALDYTPLTMGTPVPVELVPETGSVTVPTHLNNPRNWDGHECPSRPPQGAED